MLERANPISDLFPEARATIPRDGVSRRGIGCQG